MGFPGRMLVPAILHILLLPVATIFSTDVVDISGSKVDELRNPRLFYVSTTVSTVSVTTRCYFGNGQGNNPPDAIPRCCYAALDGTTSPGTFCGARRRRLVMEDMPDGWMDESSRDIAEQDVDFSHNESPQDIGEEEEEHSRDAKLMLYWVTTTSTTTTYTSTSTLATVNCTPEDWTMLSCTAG